MTINIRQKQTGTHKDSCRSLSLPAQCPTDKELLIKTKAGPAPLASNPYSVLDHPSLSACACADVVLRMLNFNTAQVSGKDPGELYKVLILDRFSKDIIAPLLRVNDLRKQGVTLHLMIEADRQSIPDVPAIYLVQPSSANIDRIVLDASQGLYEALHLNFTSALPMRQVEQLAAGAVKAGCLPRIG